MTVAPLPPVAMFDLDNTLIDRQAAYLRWARHFVAERGLPLAALDDLIAFDRDGFARRDEVFTPMRSRYRLEESVEELIAAYRVSYPTFVTAEPEVSAELARLRDAGWRLALVTNGPPTQDEKIKRAGFSASFDAVCVSEVVGVRKPDPAIFSLAASMCGAELVGNAHAWMVGDAPHYDIGGGRGSGMSTIWIRRGRIWPEAGFAPDVIVDSIGEAFATLLPSR